MIVLHREGKSPAAIATALGMSERYVKERLTEAGEIKPMPHGGARIRAFVEKVEAEAAERQATEERLPGYFCGRCGEQGHTASSPECKMAAKQEPIVPEPTAPPPSPKPVHIV